MSKIKMNGGIPIGVDVGRDYSDVKPVQFQICHTFDAAVWRRDKYPFPHVRNLCIVFNSLTEIPVEYHTRLSESHHEKRLGINIRQ